MLKRALAIVLTFSAIVVSQSFTAESFAQAKGATRAREVKAAQQAEVTVTLNEQFFNSLLDTIFTRMRAPSFPLSLADAQPAVNLSARASFSHANDLSHQDLKRDACESAVVLEREANGVRTAVKFENGRVRAPLAFRGSYSLALIGCVNFQGWANTVINLSFDRERQILSANVTVEDIQLSNIPSLASGMVIRLVQNSIDRRINPIQILQAAQVSTRIPIAGSGGALRMRATEIRPEVVPGALSLHIFYEFTPAE